MLDTYESFSIGQYKEIKFNKILGYQNEGPIERGTKFLNFWTVRPKWIEFSKWVNIKK